MAAKKPSPESDKQDTLELLYLEAQKQTAMLEEILRKLTPSAPTIPGLTPPPKA